MTAHLPHYQALERTSMQMAVAAQAGDWPEVRRLQGQAREQVAALKAAGVSGTLTATQQQAKLAALKAILRLDAQVRNLAEPDWVKIDAWLYPARNGQVGQPAADTQGKH